MHTPWEAAGNGCIARRNVRWYGHVTRERSNGMGKKDKGGKETRKPKKPKA
jgi:hypothetical protein